MAEVLEEFLFDEKLLTFKMLNIQQLLEIFQLSLSMYQYSIFHNMEAAQRIDEGSLKIGSDISH